MPSPQNDDDDDRTSDDRRSKKSKIKVMDASGQTDSERRELRSKLRNLNKTIGEQGDLISQQMEDASSNTFDDIRMKNNQLFEQVRYTREAVLESENLDMITTKAAKQVEKLIQIPRYDVNRLLMKLRSKCCIQAGSSTSFDWKLLGVETGSCFNTVPSRVYFMNGPIGSEYTPKERKKPERKRKMDEDVEEQEPEEVEQQKQSKHANQNKLSAMEELMSNISTRLKKKCLQSKEECLEKLNEEMGQSIEEMDEESKQRLNKRAKKGGVDKVCAVQFLFNPQSFTQTVENFFSFAFLVRNGQAEIGVRSKEDCEVLGLDNIKPGPYVKRKGKDEGSGHDSCRPTRQAIVSLNMQDWRDMCESFNVEKGDIPNRGRGNRS